MKSMTFADVVSVIALLVSVWAVVRVERAYRWLDMDDRTTALTFAIHVTRIADLEAQVAALSRAPAVKSDVPVWEIYDVVGGIPVLRTPSGDRPEVREVEERNP